MKSDVLGTRRVLHGEMVRVVSQEREMSRRLQAFMELSFDLIVVLEGGTIVDVSLSVMPILGWTPDEMKGKPLSAYLHPSDVEQCACKDEGAGKMVCTRWLMKSEKYLLIAWRRSAPDRSGLVYAVGREVPECDITDCPLWPRDLDVTSLER